MSDVQEKKKGLPVWAIILIVLLVMSPALVVPIGFVTAIAVPKFSSAVTKARASEVPMKLSQIIAAQEVYRSEGKPYQEIDSDSELYRKLGVKVESDYFSYHTFVAEDGRVVAVATVKAPFYDSVEPGDRIWLDSFGERGTSNTAMYQVLGQFLN